MRNVNSCPFIFPYSFFFWTTIIGKELKKYCNNNSQEDLQLGQVDGWKNGDGGRKKAEKVEVTL